MRSVMYLLLGRPDHLGATMPTLLWFGDRRSQLMHAMELASDEYVGVIEFAELRWRHNSRAVARRAELAAKYPGTPVGDFADLPIEVDNDDQANCLLTHAESSKRFLYFVFGAPDQRNATQMRLLWWGTRRATVDLVRALAVDEFIGVISQPTIRWKHGAGAAAKRSAAAAREGLPVAAFAGMGGIEIESIDQAAALFGGVDRVPELLTV